MNMLSRLILLIFALLLPAVSMADAGCGSAFSSFFCFNYNLLAIFIYSLGIYVPMIIFCWLMIKWCKLRVGFFFSFFLNFIIGNLVGLASLSIDNYDFLDEFSGMKLDFIYIYGAFALISIVVSLFLHFLWHLTRRSKV